MSEKRFYNFDRIDLTGPLFNNLEKCRGVLQNPIHHPEGDVFNHSIQTFYRAKKETSDIDLLVSALLHDVGKLIDPYGHDKIALEMLDGFISPKTAWLIKNHMRFWDFILGGMKRQKKVFDLIENEWFVDLSMLCRFDKMGRTANYFPKYDRIEIIEFLKCMNQKQS